MDQLLSRLLLDEQTRLVAGWVCTGMPIPLHPYYCHAKRRYPVDLLRRRSASQCFPSFRIVPYLQHLDANDLNKENSET